MPGTAAEIRTNSLATFSYGLGHTSVVWPAKAYIYLFCADMGCCLKVMTARDGLWESIKGIRVIVMSWWWKWAFFRKKLTVSLKKKKIV